MMPIRDGGEVAVFKRLDDIPSEVVEIATVQHAGPLYVELTDGRKFATLGGIGLNTQGVIVEARDEHRAALAKRHESKVSA